jgi:diadenosine tetraphosphate (Ap4A) HIT family hydrolase
MELGRVRIIQRQAGTKHRGSCEYAENVPQRTQRNEGEHQRHLHLHLIPLLRGEFIGQGGSYDGILEQIHEMSNELLGSKQGAP